MVVVVVDDVNDVDVVQACVAPGCWCYRRENAYATVTRRRLPARPRILTYFIARGWVRS